ncbi:glycoside hydrolase family 32 protein [Corynebacterium glutamicum]|uniref:glycoside hydrolase family 32 protein n=1 Tax=Corynebacterium glutamicum TaxID=1718 RepID=UPI0011B3AE76|nr:GH32 C-terminal domain-containing protein [Corynebacterium glutamicum]TWS36082.1 beta-fructosidase [Corynebacterium glutamicum]TWS41979.1 beta-fructosidase [Corynebacterium glutamicum]TWS47728.1 beta-fructosidase [Corynebacterium glutamicum]TWS50338.1 beta-fructosidase [Corynebacterium glutamicum]
MANVSGYHRPELHITAESGVLFAPAGVLLDDDTWHFFHQYRPSPDHGPRWAHQFAERTPFVWDICDDVLAPEGDETQVRAGSVVSNNGGVDLYFTSVVGPTSTIQLAHINNIRGTTELINEDELGLDPDVSRIGEVVGNTDGYVKFRSPCVIPGWEDQGNRDEGHSGWLMLAVTGPVEAPTVVVLDSPDGREWSITGPLSLNGLSGLESDEVLVAPRMIRLRDEVDHEIYDVLIVTIEQDGIDISGYLVGQLNGSEFDVKTPFTRIDFGHDFSRPRNTNYAETTIDYDFAHIFGLMNGVGRLDSPTEHLSWKEEGWANTISFPRVVTLQDGTVFQTPPEGLLDAIHESEAAAGWTGLCEIPSNSSVEVALKDQNDEIAATITHRHNQLVVDRSMNPNHAGDPHAIAPLTDDETDSLFIVVDGSTVEVFADGGYVSMASRVYFNNGPFSEFEVTTTGDTSIIRQESHFPVDFSSVSLDIDDLTALMQFDENEPHEGPVR